MAIHWSGDRLITFLDKSDSSVPALVSQLTNEISPQVSAGNQSFLPDTWTTAENADIYDLGRSLSSALRNCEANGNQRFIPSLITTMLGALMKNFWPDSVVLDDPLVALPRHPVEGYDPLLRFSIYRRPRLVLFAHVEEPSGSDDETSDDDEEEEEEEEEEEDVDDAPSYSSSRRMTASEFCADFRGDSKASEELDAGPGYGDSVAPLSEVGALEDTDDDSYLQWSILTGAYADLYLMGVICIGTDDTVWGTMASMLYQRRSWGISQPVFSLLLDGELSTVVSPIVSWLSDGTHPTDLPNVLATCLARYDLSVPDQSLAFSRLLQRLNSHVTEMQTLFERVVQSWYLESAGPPLYPWRADTFSNSQFAEGGHRWRNEGDIRNWVQSCETERSTDSGSSSSSMAEQGKELPRNLDPPVKQPISSQAYSTNIHHDQEIGMTDSGSRSLCSRVGNTADNSPPPPPPRINTLKGGEKKVSKSKSLANSSAQSDSSSLNIPVMHTPDGSDGGNTPESKRLSCNEFCRSERNGRVAKYLGQRNIFPIVHPIGDIDGVPIPGERANKHVEDFKRFTDIPKGALLDLINAKATSQWGESLRREISELANALGSNKLNLKFVTSQSPNGTVMSNISDRFEALLYISIRACQLAQDVYRLTLPEAAVRRQWDILMMEATSNMKELNIDAVLEQTIRLPLNTNLEAVRAKGCLVSAAGISGNSTWRQLILDVRNSDFMNERLGPDGEWGKDLPITIYDSLITQNSEHYEMVKNAAKIRGMQSEEPQQTRCDGMVSLSVQVLDAPPDPESAYQRKCIEHLQKLALVDLAASATGGSQIGKVSDMTLAVENNDIMQSSRIQITMVQGGEKEGWVNVDEDKGNDELPPSESVDARHPLDQILAVGQEDPVQPSLKMLEAKSEEEPTKKKEPEREIKAKVQARLKKRVASGDLKLPLLVQEHQRSLSDDDKKRNAVNQARLDIAASLKFLAALGIYDFSVYTIATEGTRGTLCYGYMEQGKNGEPDIGYIYEHNTRTFNIASPLDVFNLAITLGNICVENGKVLRDKFALIAEELKNDLEDTQIASKRFWTAETQNDSIRVGFSLRYR